MRGWVVVFLLCWILGISLGNAGVSLLMLIPIAVAASSLATRLPLPLPYAVAAGALVLLGFFYAPPAGDAAAPCTVPLPVTGTISAPPQGRELITQYVFDTGDCTLLLTLAPYPPYHEGDGLELTGRPPERLAELAAKNPGYAEYLGRRGIAYTWYQPEVVRHTPSPRLRATLQDRAARHIAGIFPEPTAGLVAAMLLNNVNSLSPEIVESFRATGLSHIIAISGSNISLLAGLVLVGLSAAPLTPRWRTAILTTLLWLYIIGIGAPVSAVRAAWFWTVALLAFRLHRLVSLPTAFFLTATVMITATPALVQDVGFQLSMAAVSGIFLTAFLRRDIGPSRTSLLRAVVTIALATLGATLATAPISAYHFGTFAPVGLLANLLIVPLMSVFLIAAIAAVLIALVLPVGGITVAWFVDATLRITASVTNVLARVPGGYLENITVPGWSIAIFYGAIGLAAHWWLRRQGRTWREVWQ